MTRIDSLRSRSGRARALLAVAGMAVMTFAAGAQPAAGQNVVVHLTHYADNVHAVNMAVHLAREMQAAGAHVTLLLDLEGVRLAGAEKAGGAALEQEQSIVNDFDAFVQAGGAVLLCPHCAARAGLADGHLRAGARIGKTGEFSQVILAADKILDY